MPRLFGNFVAVSWAAAPRLVGNFVAVIRRLRRGNWAIVCAKSVIFAIGSS